MPRDVERFWRTTQALRRFDYGPRAATLARVADAGYAPIASPVFSGDPRAPTPPVGDSDTSIATTEFVTDAITAALPGITHSVRVRTVSGTLNSAVANGGILRFDTIDHDSDGYAAGGTFDRLTIPAGLGGLYLLIGWSSGSGNQATTLGMGVLINGSQVVSETNQSITGPASVNYVLDNGAVEVGYLADGATIQLRNNSVSAGTNAFTSVILTLVRMEPSGPAGPPGTGTGTGGGDIDGVLAGLGLTGGGTSGTVTLDLAVPVSVTNGGTGATTATAALASLGAAPLASPVFTGDPRAPTPAPGDSDNSVATTAFVGAAVAAAPNQTITLTSDVAGSGTASITTTLATVNANLGTFNNITINAKGLATAGSNTAYLTTNQVITLSGDISGSGTTAISTTLATVPVSKGGTNATALPVNTGGAYGLTSTLLQTTGTAVSPVSDAAGTIGFAGGQTVYVLGLNGSGQIDLGRANGTFASPTAVLAGQPLGAILIDGSYAGSWNATSRAQFLCNAAENWTSAAQGTNWTLNTTTAGTLTGVTRLTVGPGVQVGAPAGGDKGHGSLNASTVYANNVPVLTGNQAITLSGDISGSGATAVVATLPVVNANVGTFQGLTVNAKGLVTAAANQSYLTSSGISGMATGQIPIAASATTITSSGNLSGAVTTSGSLATTLAANAVATTNITNANVTYAKIQNVTNNRILGNTSGSAAAPAEIVLPLAAVNGGTGDAATAWGAYTPTITASAGTFTTVSATGRFKAIGKTYHIEISVVITTNGTAAGQVVATLPAGVTAASTCVLAGRETAAVGTGLFGTIAAGGTAVSITAYDNTYPGGTGRTLILSGTFEAT